MSDAALPNPIPPLDASSEIKERVERLTGFWPPIIRDDDVPLSADVVVPMHVLQQAAALLRRLVEQEARMRGVVDAAIRLRDDATGGLGRYNELWDALDRAALAAGKEGE